MPMTDRPSGPMLFHAITVLLLRCLGPLRRLFGPRATDPELLVIAAASSATTSAARADGSASAAARSRMGSARLIVRLLPSAPTFAPRTT
jgi:hypothetical protein